MRTFDDLIAEAAAVPLTGWDFSWFAGRATEERPDWGYARLMAEAMTRATAALDVQTGGGEVLATLTRPPALLVATETWAPNVPVAAAGLAPLDGRVVRTARTGLPFRDGSFDLVVSRHPERTPWGEIARVLRPGGRFLSQQIGAGTNRELSEAMLGPLPPPGPDQHADLATEAGLAVARTEHACLRLEFFDVAAVAYFLRMVVWTVPGFTIERYLPQLRAVHDRIQEDGMFVSYAKRVLVDAVKP
ncbi:class I SAM-dependent methyltransferase [Actinoplanes sp. N902-109]|uniref:class I SAM-dependent methyltransferase n=1 Tax=Actinoplanes sp. (strain N902-109) TaxID=649831 RepID=UPI0003294A55|nr:class I SAM-dependent methyltransferase [Actinoplanes sp. N902-109]AGL20921.1 methyltransferase [Actinoplanes sp. N902-109]